MFYCTPKGTLTALPVIHASFLAVPHTWEKPWKNLEKTCKNLGKPKKREKMQKQKKPWKTLEKKNKKTKKNNISKLFGGGGPSQVSLMFFLFFLFFVFWFSNVFLDFLVFQGFCRLFQGFLVLVTCSHLHFFLHLPFDVFMRSSLQEPIV